MRVDEMPIRKDYVAGGYQFIECSACGLRFNAGRPGNSAGFRWSNALKAEWWAKHTGVPQTEHCLKLCEEDIPGLCKSLGVEEA